MFMLEVSSETALHTEEVAVTADLLRLNAFVEGGKPDYKLLDISEAKPTPDAVPVGSLDFCEKILGVRTTPLNVPACLRDECYTGRMVTEGGAAKLNELFKQRNQPLFVKSATVAKADYTGIYRPGDKLPDDRYFISEVVDLDAEWRCFVYKGKILDVRRYQGRYTNTLTKADFQFIQKAVVAIDAMYRNTMQAYTLDVGKSSARELPMVIEVHNFLACGFYGFHDTKILPMLAAGAKTARSSHS